MIYSSLDIRHNRQNFLSYWAIFCSFNPPLSPPPHNPENLTFEKIKKLPGDIIILYMCTMNDNHDGRLLRYGVQRTEWSATDRIFCHFFYHFLHFYPLTIRKIKMRKAPGDISILQMCTINDNHMVYGS